MRRNLNFIKEGHFICECGRKFTKSQSFYAHQSHCKTHLGNRWSEEKHFNRFKSADHWAKGKTKDDPIYGESLKRISNAVKQRLKESGNPLVVWNKSKPSSSYEHQSQTRKNKYADGTLTPAVGVGRGKYSYITYNDRKIMLRSTYEFIYALYLLYNNIDFEYETVRVPVVTDYKYSKTFISDFKIGNKIIEIKGYWSSKVGHAKKAFESAGYEYEVKYKEDIQVCYNYLKSIVDIDNILNKIIQGHNNKNYYVYKFTACL